MSIEEKAKAYDEAKARMSKAWNDNRCSLYFMNEIFPESKVSKDDDVKLTIIQFFKYASSYGCPDILSKEKAKTWIAWLEKQGNIDKASYEIAEKEKYDFVNGQFIQCRKSFDGFKEYNSYWFEYVGNDTYVGRSDNILNKKFHITPRQLYRLFTQQHYCSKENNEFEKQGEEPADKVEPKFKVGDWVVNNITKDVFLIKSVNSGYCTLEDVKGNIISPCLPQCESESHLWTIQDAKDGDVICAYPNANHPWIGIFCKLNDEGTFNSHCYLQAGQHGQFCIPSEENIFGKRNAYNHSSKDVVPATKEQREQLFQKMKEAGYEWDAEKKEPKKIETKAAMEIKTPEESLGIDSAAYNKIVDECIYGEQKPNWSEEDENRFSNLVWLIEHSNEGKATKEGFIKFINNLKSLKDRVQPQPRKEWSEEDEDMLNKTTAVINRLCAARREYVWSVNTLNKLFYWLKSLKDKVQPQWKPSEEQLTILLNVANGNYIADSNRQVLSELYRNLIKL